MIRHIKHLVAAIAIIAATASANAATNPKYIFYFIGDGMTATQVRLAEAALSSPKFRDHYASLTGREVDESLNIKSLKVTGLATSNAENRYITDSAAAGTALATGHKTNVGVISQSASGDVDYKSVAEMARDKGMKVGIVTSVSIDHATPACFYSHISSRGKFSGISDQMLASGFDYFAGGSVRWNIRAKEAKCSDKEAYEAYVKQGEEMGYRFVTTREEFDAVGSKTQQPVIATLDMLSNEQYTGDQSAMPYTIDLDKHDNAGNKISLSEYTAKGIELLENKSGFFMMVEGGKIDWACHANDAATCAYEVVAFDEAIGVAVEFAKKHPKETLIVVTGDHDCGGLTLGFAGTGYGSAFDLLAGSRISYTEFTRKAKPMILKGESFENMLKLACESFGFTNDVTDGSDGVITRTAELSDYEVDMLRKAYTKSATLRKKKDFEAADQYVAAYGGKDPFTTTCTHILNNKSGIDYSTYSHTAVPVMVFAQGVNDMVFSGYYDNTDIAKKIMQVGGLE